MKVQMDIHSYKAAFTGSAKQYNFYVNMVFPGWSNALKAGTQGLLGAVGNGTEGIVGGLMGTASSSMGLLTTKGGMDGIEFYVRSSYLPDSNFEEVATSWMGHDYKMAGKQTFSDWTITFNVDKNGILLRKFWDWQKLMHDPQANTYGNPITYMTDPEVHLLGYDTGETVCVYKMYGAWPKMIGQVALDSSVGDIATVDITFAYQYHTVTETEPGVLATLAGQGIRSFFQMGGLSEMVSDDAFTRNPTVISSAAASMIQSPLGVGVFNDPGSFSNSMIPIIPTSPEYGDVGNIFEWQPTSSPEPPVSRGDTSVYNPGTSRPIASLAGDRTRLIEA